MSDTTSSQTEIDEHEAASASRMGKAITVGFVIGTPITFAFFFAMVYWIGDVGLRESVLTALWVAIVGGGFYGGVAGLLVVLNRAGH